MDSIASFQDPYSDVSLFLTRKIKQLSEINSATKEWSQGLQKRLVERITPEFEKKFPTHHLGSAVIKRAWEKASRFSLLMHAKKEAIAANGKLNLYFLIRQNLKTVLTQKKSGSFHPYLLAQELAVKVGDSLASFDGERPKLHYLSELIWSMLFHIHGGTKRVLSPQDRLITKWVIDCLMIQPDLSHNDLNQALHKKLKLFQGNRENLHSEILKLSVDWAQQLLPTTAFYQNHTSEKIQELRGWISKQINGSIPVEEQIQDIKTAALKSKMDISLYDLEILSWSTAPPPVSGPLYEELVHEARFHLCHHPYEHWKTAITQAARFMRKASEITVFGSRSFWKERIELWSLQGELSLKSVELPDAPIFHLAKQAGSTIKLREEYLCKYPSALLGPSFVHQIAEMARKYASYHVDENSFNTWARLHGDLTPEELEAKAQETFPLIPYEVLRSSRKRPMAMNGRESH